jgi:hypothetical protein
MKTNTTAILSGWMAAAIFAAFSLDSTCGGAEPKKETAPPIAVYTAKETAEFKALAKETIAALDAGKNTEMIAKLTDLETVWDEKEESLKPKDPATWTLIDKTLDKAISALRSSKTDFPKGKVALEGLVKSLQQATKP